MRYTIFFLLILNTLSVHAQDTPIQGSFKRNIKLENQEMVTELWKFVDNYFVVTAYSKEAQQFYYTYGGNYYTSRGKLKASIRFSHYGPMKFGMSLDRDYTLDQQNLTIEGIPNPLVREDFALGSEISQTWIITGRKVNDSLVKRKVGARKTLKILTEKNFQWIAFDEEKGLFRGTGGGEYKAANGDYKEYIEFFSRDSSRVGQSLNFDYTIKNGNWIHSGLSSKGKPIYEIWSPLRQAERKSKQ
jgi:hypothetical protein